MTTIRPAPGRPERPLNKTVVALLIIGVALAALLFIAHGFWVNRGASSETTEPPQAIRPKPKQDLLEEPTYVAQKDIEEILKKSPPAPTPTSPPKPPPPKKAPTPAMHPPPKPPPPPKPAITFRPQLSFWPPTTPTAPRTGGHILKAETHIYGTCSVNIDSNIPGTVSLQVSSDINDSMTLSIPLIPQGSTIQLEPVKQRTMLGDTRLGFHARLITLPNMTEVKPNAVATDQMGANGLPGDVDNHYGKIILASLFTSGVESSASLLASTAGGPAGQAMGSIARDISRPIEPFTNLSPTITIKAGERCFIKLIDSLTLPAYQEGPS